MTTRTVRAALALVAAAALSTAAHAQQKIEMKLAYFVGDQHAMAQWLIKWSDQLEKGSNGRLVVKRFPGAQMGPTPQHYDFARTGQADAHRGRGRGRDARRRHPLPAGPRPHRPDRGDRGQAARENGVHARPGQIVVTPGAKWALFIALAALLDDGDEVLVLDPAWVSYAPMITLNGGRPVRLDLSAEENYRFTADQLRTDVTPRTKAILVNSPNNPTGRVLDGEELAAIAAVAIEHDLWVISDEIYEHLLYGERRHMSPATWLDMAYRTIIINGFSKAYVMTGWRLGWLCAPEPVPALAMNLHSQGVTSAASFAMAAGVAALNGSQDCVADLVAALKQMKMTKIFQEHCGAEPGPVRQVN